jgi:hypothetical protein
MKPYVYKITSKDGRYYFGVRWDYSDAPEKDLLITYFTSSSLVHQIIKEEGIFFFEKEILKIFDHKEDALEYEYLLIKSSINDSMCLNRAMGKCTIWDDELRKKVSSTMKSLWENPNYRQNIQSKNSGLGNHNYKRPSWRNVSSDIQSWVKVKYIYEDFIKENWDLNKYGFGRHFLMKRYGISQGTARCLIKKLRSCWNPNLDQDYMSFYSEKCSDGETGETRGT